MVSVECGHDGCQTDGVENRACLPIIVPKGDPDFKPPIYKKPCLMFVRTQEVLKDECLICK